MIPYIFVLLIVMSPLSILTLFEVCQFSSIGKESAFSARDPSSIARLGRSAGEGTGYPLQCPWASLVAQLAKNLPAMWETWVLSLDWEDPLEKGKATHSSILAWRIPWTVQSMGSQRVGQYWVTFTSLFSLSLAKFINAAYLFKEPSQFH